MNVTPPSPLSGRPLTPTPQGAERPDRSAPQSGPAAEPTKGQASLWEILTPEEREFFARQPSLTYRPGMPDQETQMGPLGRQLDVRG
jgi:hypothetical protein